MAERDEKGRFLKGTTGNPTGRAPKEREERYYRVLIQKLTDEDWAEIVTKAIRQAKTGDAKAREWLSQYVIQPLAKRLEVAGPEGGPLQVTQVRIIKPKVDE